METVTAMAVGLLVVLAGLGLAVGTVAWLWRSLQSAGAGYVARLDAQEVEIEDLWRQIHELRESRISDHALLQDWITHARRLAGMFREATGNEPPAEPASSPRNMVADMGRLAATIALRFTVSDINGLGFELGIDGALTGETVNARAQSLVRVAQQRAKLLRLVELCRQQRPEGGF